MLRRGLIRLSGAVIGSMAIAGCSSENGTEDNAGRDESSTNTPTSTSTATPTPESSYVQEEFDSPFVVGSGEKSIEYRVTQAALTREIGGQYSSEEANGIFIVITMEMTNIGDETVDITSRHLKAMNEDGQTFDADTGLSFYLSSDDRFDVEGISFEQLNPGLTTDGAVVFDVVPGDYYFLSVEPAGIFSAARPHIVPLGPAE
jgi:hypothetical protein